MLNYKCYDITLEDGSLWQDSVEISMPETDLSDPLDRQDHLVALSGSLESVVGRYVNSFSYIRIEDAS